MITLFRHYEWEFGIHAPASDFGGSVIYFGIPGCEQISWHYGHEGAELPVYEKKWDGKTGSTLPKLMAFIEREFKEILK